MKERRRGERLAGLRKDKASKDQRSRGLNGHHLKDARLYLKNA